MSSNNITFEPVAEASSTNTHPPPSPSLSPSPPSPSSPKPESQTPVENTTPTPTNTAELPKINISLMPDDVDTIVKAVINHYTQRTNAGLDKNGKPLERNDMSIIKWMHHAQEELMDNIIYIEKLKQMYIYKAKAMTMFLEEESAKFTEEELNAHLA